MKNIRVWLTSLALVVGLLTTASAADEPNGLKLTKNFSKKFEPGRGFQLIGNTPYPVSQHFLNAEGSRVAFQESEEVILNNIFARFGTTKTHLLDAQTGKELAEIRSAAPMRFAPGGKTLLVSQNFMEAIMKAGQIPSTPIRMAQLWELADDKKPKQRYVIDSVAFETFSPDGKLLACLGGPEQKFGNSGTVVVGLPKMNRQGLGTGSISLRFFELWEVDTARMATRLNCPKGYQFPLQDLSFTSDSKLLVIPVENTPNIDPRNPQDIPNKLRKERTSKFLLFDVAAKKVARSIEAKGLIKSYCIVGKPDSELGKTYLAAALQDDDKAQVMLWNLETGELAATLVDEKLEKDQQLLLTVAAAPDGNTLATNLVIWTPQAAVQAAPNGNQPIPPVNAAGGFGANGGAQRGNAGGAAGFAGAGGAVGFGGGAVGFGGIQGGFGGGAVGFGGGVNIGFGGMAGVGGGFQGNNGAANIGFGGGAPAPNPNPMPPARGANNVKFIKNQIVLWDMDTKAKRHALEVPAYSAAFAGSRAVATIFPEKDAVKLKLWDVFTGKELAEFNNCLHFESSRDGNTILTAIQDGADHELTVWKAERVAQPPPANKDE